MIGSQDTNFAALPADTSEVQEMVVEQDFDMEESVENDRLAALDGIVESEELLLNSPLVEELSTAHVGSWNTLVSRTNWEKGAVILQWKTALIEAELPRAAYSDEAWARRVGNVSAQHVGRLRRVAERFAGVEKDYPGLYWSHFQAALDWEDAEMWLEGAVGNAWSVAQMRVQRWEAIGAPAELKPRDEDIFTAELDEDVNPRIDSTTASTAERTESRTAAIGPADLDAQSAEGFDPDQPPFELDDDVSPKKESKKSDSKTDEFSDGPSTGELLATLKDFSDLPDDLGEALDSLKVAILNHKLAGWKDCPPPKLIKKLDALKALISSVDEA